MIGWLQMDATARRLRARKAALARWSKEDTVTGTQAMRTAYRQQLEQQAIDASPEPLSPQEIARRGDALWLLHQNRASDAARRARERRRSA